MATHSFISSAFQSSVKSSRTIAASALLLLLSACAAPLPLPFQLVDGANKTYQGTFNAGNQSMEVWIDNKLYQGFYVVATSVATSDAWPTRFGAFGSYPRDRFTIINSNNARAHLSSVEGDHLSCEFLFQGNRVIGECKSPQGKSYQLVANAVDR